MSLKEAVRRLMEKSILNFHFDYWNPSLNNNLVSQVMNSAQNLPIYWNVGTGFQTTLRALVGCFDCFDCSKVQIFMMFFRQELMVKFAD